jgi:hypothetical protein
MDHRDASFLRKFEGAARHLAVRPEQVVSLKLRENVNSYDEYLQLVEVLQHEFGLQCSEIQADLQADLQGRGYLLGDGKTRLILVEHESGLELLYIAGSIASLIGLVPLVLQGWRALRGQFAGIHGLPDHGVEIRRIDASGNLQEEQIHDWHFGSFGALGSVLPALATTAGLIETEIRALSDQLKMLNSRVSLLEEQRPLSMPPTGEKASKSGARRTKLEKGKKTKS